MQKNVEKSSAVSEGWYAAEPSDFNNGDILESVPSSDDFKVDHRS